MPRKPPTGKGHATSPPVVHQLDMRLDARQDAGERLLRTAVRRVARTTGRRIDLMAYRPSEFRELFEAGNGFVRAVVAGERHELVGSLDEVFG